MAFKIIIAKPYLDEVHNAILQEITKYHVNMRKVIEYIVTAYSTGTYIEDTEQYDFFVILLEQDFKLDRMEGGSMEILKSSWTVAEEMVKIAAFIEPQLLPYLEMIHTHLNKKNIVDPTCWEPIVNEVGGDFEIIINDEPTASKRYYIR